MENTTSRLRRTFAYPSDSDSDTLPDILPETLDEQEQETLIAALTQQNELRNAQFRILLLCLPAVSTLPYLIALVSPSSTSDRNGGTDRSTALLSLTSLACTAWTLWVRRPGVTGIGVLDGWVGGGKEGKDSGRRKRDDDDYGSRGDIANSPFWAEEHRDSPLARYLPYLNVGLCAVLVLTGLLSRSGASQGYWGHVGLNNLPAIVYGVVLVAKMVMGSVDPERELSALRYEYKGA
ncbi:uncharacterized protein GGS22DRAFT_169289 [Annulohypoxylon maeteangense]|uniref:uncharacterized protein n=1 Tax=Annulohypoxylon maeteangense TaxID=1927788 RepID=UPI002008B458|nr:uncharacterized protein GGS22DRAFT_169289 [Annulohypoxylon maeteangense]KAI0882401.1 hypothetical protein GGS22DRAFT_169289 [Annulohypoxylon maeteangense]